MTFTTKADAWPANQYTDTGRGVWVDHVLGKDLFGHYARKWLETRSALEETTWAKYEGSLRLLSLPASATAGSPRSIPRADTRCPAGLYGIGQPVAVRYPELLGESLEVTSDYSYRDVWPPRLACWSDRRQPARRIELARGEAGPDRDRLDNRRGRSLAQANSFAARC